MKRLHFIEIEDQPWLPESIRDAVTDYLQFVTYRTKPYSAVIGRLEFVLERTKTDQIIDLCSGGAGPWLSLKHSSAKLNSIKVLLTDKFPNIPALEQAKTLSSGTINYAAESVDATNVPETITGFRTLFASFHHFTPDQARAILSDAIEKRQGIAVFEATHRSILAVLLMLILPILVMIFTPLIRPFRWSRIFWTYVIPVIPFIVMFDGIVSCLRTYNVSELQVLVTELKSAASYKWEIAEQQIKGSPLPVTYLIGYANNNADNAE